MKPIPPAGTPVDQKLYNEACQKVTDLQRDLFYVLEAKEADDKRFDLAFADAMSQIKYLHKQIEYYKSMLPPPLHLL